MLRSLGIFFVVLALLPTATFVFALNWYADKRAWVDDARATTGTVTELIASDEVGADDDDTPTYTARIAYDVDGRRYTLGSSLSSNPPLYDPGDPVDILYNPDDPDDAIIDSWLNKYLGQTVLGVLSLIPALTFWILGVVFVKAGDRGRSQS